MNCTLKTIHALAKRSALCMLFVGAFFIAQASSLSSSEFVQNPLHTTVLYGQKTNLPETTESQINTRSQAANSLRQNARVRLIERNRSLRPFSSDSLSLHSGAIRSEDALQLALEKHSSLTAIAPERARRPVLIENAYPGAP